MLSKKIKRTVDKYKGFKQNLLTKDGPLKALVKFVYMNFFLYILKKEFSFTFLDKIKVVVKRGDGVTANYYCYLQEPNESVFLIKYLRESDTFLDIGANVGHYSLIASIIPKANVIAVEPIPDTFKRLKANLMLNNVLEKVECLNIGLAEKKGKLSFSNTFFTTNKVVNDSNGIEINVNTVDEILSQRKVNAMKIDVEGFEYFVLKGAHNLLSSDDLKVLIIELNESGKSFEVDDSTIVELVKAYGFLPYRYDLLSKQIFPLTDKNKKQFNTIFIKDLEHVNNRILNSDDFNFSKFSF